MHRIVVAVPRRKEEFVPHVCDNGELDGRLWITSIGRVTRNLIDRVTTREVGRIQR